MKSHSDQQQDKDSQRLQEWLKIPKAERVQRCLAELEYRNQYQTLDSQGKEQLQQLIEQAEENPKKANDLYILILDKVVNLVKGSNV